MSEKKFVGLDALSAFINNLNEKFATKSQLNNIEFPVTSVNGQTGNVIIDSATQVQGDWNENSEDSPAFIKNRTHYISKSAITALPTTSLLVHKGSVDLYEIPVEGLTDKAECVVTIDGVSYNAIASKGVFNAYEWFIIGNGELIGESGNGSDLPFGIFIDKYNENYMQLADSNKSGTVEVTIEVVSEVVHKIPDIYLPAKIGVEGTGTYAEVFNNLTQNNATGDYSHAENFKTNANGYSSHAEGLSTTASGYGSHAEGNGTQAKSSYSHAEGWSTIASGIASHSSGIGTEAKGEAQTVVGQYNIVNTSSLFIVGAGSTDSARKNAFTVNSSGTGEFFGDVIAYGNSSSTPSISLSALKAEIDNIEEISSADIQALFN